MKKENLEPIEVEVKIPLSDINLEEFISKLKQLHYLYKHVIEEYDEYFNVPYRDFMKTDEALRIRFLTCKRKDTSMKQAEITYKGPKIGNEMKIRKEVTATFKSPEDGHKMHEILTSLGFKAVLPVKKKRTVYEKIINESTQIHLMVDEVDRLGNFLEIELLIYGEGKDIETAKKIIKNELQQLFKETPQEIRKSYLELLLEKIEREYKDGQP